MFEVFLAFFFWVGFVGCSFRCVVFVGESRGRRRSGGRFEGFVAISFFGGLARLLVIWGLIEGRTVTWAGARERYGWRRFWRDRLEVVSI